MSQGPGRTAAAWTPQEAGAQGRGRYEAPRIVHEAELERRASGEHAAVGERLQLVLGNVRPALVHPGEALHFEYSTSQGVPGS